jgi:hypothetical protein
MSSAVAVYGSGDGDEASSDIVDSEDLGMGCRRRRLSQSDVEPRQLRTAPVNRGALNPGSLAQPPQQDSGPRLSIATPTSVGLRGKALGQDLASGPREDSDWANSPGVEVLFATHTVATGRIGVPPLPAGQALAQGLGPRAKRRGGGYQDPESVIRDPIPSNLCAAWVSAGCFHAHQSLHSASVQYTIGTQQMDIPKQKLVARGVRSVVRCQNGYEKQCTPGLSSRGPGGEAPHFVP